MWRLKYLRLLIVLIWQYIDFTDHLPQTTISEPARKDFRSLPMKYKTRVRQIPLSRGPRRLRRGGGRPWTRLSVVIGLILILAGCAAGRDETGRVETLSADRQVVYIAHVNDTHAHLAPTIQALTLDGQKLSLPVGGYPRLHTQIARWREAAAGEQAGFLFLHAGDAFQGSGSFMLFHGQPEAALLNRIGLDAMVLGNHESDALRAMDIQRDARGRITAVAPGESLPAGLKLAEFIRMADFPVLAANMHVPESSPLSGIPNLVPWVIAEVNGDPLGLFGTVLSDMPDLAYPGRELVFASDADTARDMVRMFVDYVRRTAAQNNGFLLPLDYAPVTVMNH